jgi:hypothetical protein
MNYSYEFSRNVLILPDTEFAIESLAAMLKRPGMF